MKLQNDVGRSCGECTACCKFFAVPEVGKHGAEWCPRCVLGKGCTIYQDRPFACREFTCIWLNGKGDESFRPDRLGVMIDTTDVKLGDRLVSALHFWEARKGALEQSVVSEMAEANKDNGFIVVYHRIRTKDTFSIRVEMRRHLFTEEEVEMFRAHESIVAVSKTN